MNTVHVEASECRMPSNDVRYTDNVVSLTSGKPVQSFAHRKFVPFNGFDGQALAGTGALVWEGERLG